MLAVELRRNRRERGGERVSSGSNALETKHGVAEKWERRQTDKCEQMNDI